MEYTSHYSVLLNECLDAVSLGVEAIDNPIVADMTWGGGGHSLAMAKLFPESNVYSVDQDPDALANGARLIKEGNFEGRVHLNKMNFESFPDWFKLNHPDKKISGVIMDLGVSSHHFDKFDRGFSFREDAPLDMRMDHHDEDLETAADILNSYSEEDLANMIFKYADERYSRRIAKLIVESRAEEKVERTKQLENICFHAYPKKDRHKGIHPATKTFQALRIHVNRELEVLENTIEKMFGILENNGVLAIISFHSLEDRIVKHKYKEIFQNDKTIANIVTKKPIYPSERELGENPRSRSAKLRVLQKVEAGSRRSNGKKASYYK